MAQNDPATDIKAVLIADGVSTPIVVSSEPKKPNAVITLYNTPGDPPDPKFLIDYPGLQIRSRATTYTEAYDNILEVYDLLLGRGPFTQSTTRYTGIIADTGIAEIGWDKSNRRILVCNLKLFVEPLFVAQNRKQN